VAALIHLLLTYGSEEDVPAVEAAT